MNFITGCMCCGWHLECTSIKILSCMLMSACLKHGSFGGIFGLLKLFSELVTNGPQVVIN